MNRAPDDKNPYIDLIDSDSQPMPPPKKQSKYTYASNSRSNPLPSQNASKAQPCDLTQPSYEDVACFKKLKEIQSLNNHYFQLKDFLQNPTLNILFVFGPSGCGKTLLVQTALKANEIAFEYAAPKMDETEDGELIYQDIFDMIGEVLNDRSTIRQKIIIFKEYPIDLKEAGSQYHFRYKQFRENVWQEMRQTQNHNKYIFLLNTEIYSPFYLLSENSETKSLKKLSNVSVVKFEPYGLREMKIIIDHFLAQNPTYSSCLSDARAYEDVIVEANGDARKALNLIYHRKLCQMAPRSAPICQQFSLLGTSCKNRVVEAQGEQQEPKVTIFHMLGKFLYGKRYNIYYNPQAAKKKDRGQISRVYTAQQLKRLNPKFYFRPVQLLDRSQMALSVFTELIHQNFINRYGSVIDVARMSNLFRYYDSYLSDSLNRYELFDQMQEILKQLMTWGILIYNRNSAKVSTGMYRIQRCKNILCKQLIKKKLEVIKGYYLKAREGGRLRLQDMVKFAHLTRSQRYKSQYSFFHQKLVEVVMDNRKSNMHLEIDSSASLIQDEDLEIGKENCSRINQLAQAIVGEVNRRSRLLGLALDDSDASDIDSEPE